MIRLTTPGNIKMSIEEEIYRGNFMTQNNGVGPGSSGPGDPDNWAWFLATAAMGVAMFYVISGWMVS